MIDSKSFGKCYEFLVASQEARSAFHRPCCLLCVSSPRILTAADEASGDRHDRLRKRRAHHSAAAIRAKQSPLDLCSHPSFRCARGSRERGARAHLLSRRKRPARCGSLESHHSSRFGFLCAETFAFRATASRFNSTGDGFAVHRTARPGEHAKPETSLLNDSADGPHDRIPRQGGAHA